MPTSNKILVMGLPGAGKTTLAQALAPLIGAVHFNADKVRATLSRDLGFSPEDRISQAHRMSWLCDQVVEHGYPAIADFVCPTPETREAFGSAFTVWVDRLSVSRFHDTNQLFVPPSSFDARVVEDGISAPQWAHRVELLWRQEAQFNWQKPTALFLGRYQPFHDGHRALICEGISRLGQACIAVRDTFGTDTSNPFDFAFVRRRIEDAMAQFRGRYVIVRVPNVTDILYGRNVGYRIERIDLDDGLQQITATRIRAAMLQGAIE